MGIKPVSGKSTGGTRRKQPGEKVSGQNFHDILSQSDQPVDNQKIQSLFENIETAADLLVESKDDSALIEYRRRIKDFLSEVLSESREIKVITTESIHEDALVIVKIVDKKLDDLAALVIREEVERGEMMMLIDEIKGIIIDLYR